MLASLTPCFRQKAATGTPASCSLKGLMICSFRKSVRFMLWSSYSQSELQSELKSRAQGPILTTLSANSFACRASAFYFVSARRQYCEPSRLSYLKTFDHLSLNLTTAI